MTHLEDIIKLGFLVGDDVSESIDKMTENEYEKILKHVKEKKPFMVTREIIDEVLAEEIDIIKQIERKNVFTVQDFVKSLNSRYEFLRQLLEKKVELKNIVSIGTVSYGDVSVIGMVKEIVVKNGQKTVILEDPTGYVDVIMDSSLVDKLELDDVIAVSGQSKNKKLFANKLLFPSIPIRPVKLSKKSIMLAFTDKKVKCDYIVSKNKIIDNKKKKEHKIDIPAIFRIGDVVILVLMGSDPLKTLNRRYLNIDRFDFLLEPAPDVILTDNDVKMSYKGISIVPKDMVIDLKTRKVEKIE